MRNSIIEYEQGTLSQLCEIIGGHPAPKENEFSQNGDGVPFVRMKDLGAYHLTNNLIKVSNNIRRDFFNNSNYKIIKKGAILLPRSGSVALNHRAILGMDACIVSHICALQVKNSELICNKYLYYFLTTVDMVNITKKTTGLDAITFGDLGKLRVKFPSISIQKKITAILDQADELRKKDQQLLDKYDELLQSIFYDMFGDPVKNEKGWEKGTIRDVVREVKYGTSKPAEENGSYPYLRMNNITYNGDWDFSDLKYINLDNKEREKYLLQKNDLVFNRTNSKELVGKTAVYQLNDEMAIAGYLIRVRTNEKANPVYLSAYLNSKHGKAVLMGMCKNIIGMANINAQELQGIKVLIPSISLQNKFASIAQNIQKQKQQVKQQIEQSENLFQSLLQRAFKGELVKD